MLADKYVLVVDPAVFTVWALASYWLREKPLALSPLSCISKSCLFTGGHCPFRCFRTHVEPTGTHGTFSNPCVVPVKIVVTYAAHLFYNSSPAPPLSTWHTTSANADFLPWDAAIFVAFVPCGKLSAPVKPMKTYTYPMATVATHQFFHCP